LYNYLQSSYVALGFLPKDLRRKCKKEFWKYIKTIHKDNTGVPPE